MSKSAGVKFEKDGPSIPVKLLQALEDGGLVVFCGAGVSCRCGLPAFRGLLESVCETLGRQLEPDEHELFKAKSFEGTLGLIESRIGKERLRPAVRHILQLKPDSDLSTHKALLQLAASRQGCLRLVTTNFDQGFELAPFDGTPKIDYAPYLPQPGSRWSSVVHLHGGLGNQRDPDGDFLVLTSADFGKAYITEGWAGRFLSELFRRVQAVLFIGYSVSDPAVRYIVDAFAADRGHAAEAFILTGAREQEAAQHARTWRSRGIEPIIYDPRDNHRLLHETIQNCASRYRAGLFDRDSIVLEYGSRLPLGGLEDEAASQLVWALRDDSGHSARRFAGLKPSPSLEWLRFLDEAGLFNLPSGATAQPPAVAGLSEERFLAPLHPASEALCGWLCEHLDSRNLVNWITKNGSHLHPYFAAAVRGKLSGPGAPPIPHGARLFWTLLSMHSPPLYDSDFDRRVVFHFERLKDGPWNPVLRQLFLSCLESTVRFAEPFGLETDDSPNLELISSYARVELLPAAGRHTDEVVEQLLGRADFPAIAGDLLPELTEILRKGLDHLQLLEQANSDYDGTYLRRPSIDDHNQNSPNAEWSACVQLLRVTWERVAVENPSAAGVEVERWMHIDLPLFRRLVIWSVGRLGGLSPGESVDYLAKQPPSAVWGVDTHREFLQYLGRLAQQFSADDSARLVAMITKGPPRSQYRPELSGEEVAAVSARAVYLRLAKLRDGGLALPLEAQEALAKILKEHPQWDHPITEHEEFLFWIGDTGSFPFDFKPQTDDYVHQNDAEVISDIRKDPGAAEVLARWRGLLEASPERGASILEQLGTDGIFENEIWTAALEQLSREQRRRHFIPVLARFVTHLEASCLSAHLYELTTAVLLYSAENEPDEQPFWTLWDFLLNPAIEIVREPTDSVFELINSSIGHLAEALLNRLGEMRPESYEAIPRSLRERLEGILQGTQPAHSDARIVIARALPWLHRMNPELVAHHFIPLFDWDASHEARGLWSGYLFSPKMSLELWTVLRPLFWKVFPHSAELGEAERQLYSLLAHLLLREEFHIRADEARRALTVGTASGRKDVAWYWWRQADADPTSDHGAILFRERLKALLENVWPIDLELRDEASSEMLAEIALCCGSEFPNAVATIRPLLRTLAGTGQFCWSLSRRDYPEKYPRATLGLLDSVIDDASRELRNLLTRLRIAEPDLANDPAFRRLDDILRQFE